MSVSELAVALAPASHWEQTGERGHFVQFYDDEDATQTLSKLLLDGWPQARRFRSSDC